MVSWKMVFILEFEVWEEFHKWEGGIPPIKGEKNNVCSKFNAALGMVG